MAEDNGTEETQEETNGQSERVSELARQAREEGTTWDPDEPGISDEERERRERVRARRERLKRQRGKEGDPAAAAAAAKSDGDDRDSSGPDTDPRERRAAEKVGKKARDRSGGSRKARMARSRAARKDQPVVETGDRAAMTRRQMIRLSMWGVILLWVGQMGGVFVDFFWPRRAGAFGQEISLGPLDEILARLSPGSLMTVDAAQTYLVRLGDDELIALWWTCPHLGCTVPWQGDQNLFICPCHGSTYAMSGDLLHGPAPRPMDMMAMRVEDGELFVDTGDITQRNRHEDEHVFRI